MANQYHRANLRIDEDDCETGIFKLLEQIRPSWKKSDVDIQVIRIFLSVF